MAEIQYKLTYKEISLVQVLRGRRGGINISNGRIPSHQATASLLALLRSGDFILKQALCTVCKGHQQVQVFTVCGLGDHSLSDHSNRSPGDESPWSGLAHLLSWGQGRGEPCPTHTDDSPEEKGCSFLRRRNAGQANNRRLEYRRF